MWILWWFSAIGIRGSSPRAASSLALGDVRVALKQITLRFQRGRERGDREILDLSQHTASWKNVQPWRVLIASGDAARKFSVALVAHVESGGKPNPDLAFPTDYQGAERKRRKTCGLL